MTVFMSSAASLGKTACLGRRTFETPTTMAKLVAVLLIAFFVVAQATPEIVGKGHGLEDQGVIGNDGSPVGVLKLSGSIRKLRFFGKGRRLAGADRKLRFNV
ncbi:hypothetical protein BSKO_13569 [Bryopsis sp. KO-2023]|nr:hypothetical protein BSKO_13569 [Bryopsis sp. KO-2023]